MKSLKEQLTQKCKHFNGIQNSCCKAGIMYKSVRAQNEKPLSNFPCLNTGIDTCSQRQYLTPEEVNAKLDKLHKISMWGLVMTARVKDKFKEDKELHGVVPCHTCEDLADYTIAESNHHIRVFCTNCKQSLME